MVAGAIIVVPEAGSAAFVTVPIPNANAPAKAKEKAKCFNFVICKPSLTNKCTPRIYKEDFESIYK